MKPLQCTVAFRAAILMLRSAKWCQVLAVFFYIIIITNRRSESRLWRQRHSTRVRGVLTSSCRNCLHRHRSEESSETFEGHGHTLRPAEIPSSRFGNQTIFSETLHSVATRKCNFIAMPRQRLRLKVSFLKVICLKALSSKQRNTFLSIFPKKLLMLTYY